MCERDFSPFSIQKQNDIENDGILFNIDVFPNPSSGRVNVRFSSQPEDGSHIIIMDISGRKVVSRIVTGTFEEFNLENQPAGIYFVKTSLGKNETTNKLIITK